jgi:O-antigen/teichoic acid export membrane protein
VGVELARIVCAYRICPELKVGRRYVEWEETKHLLRFNVKDMISSFSQLLLVHGNKLIVASALGPASLAVFSRPLGLLKVAETFTNRLAYVLTPTASSLQGTGQHEELRKLLVQTTRYALALVLPMILGLVILGEAVLLVWMGPRYRPGWYFPILIAGFLMTLAARPATTIALGLNLHGPLAVAAIRGAVLAIALGLANAYFGGGLTGAALAIGVPYTILGVYVAVFACRRLGVPIRDYLAKAWLPPALCSVPFALVLLASRWAFADRPLLAVVAGSAVGGVVLAVLYWSYLTPETIRAAVSRRGAAAMRRLGLSPGGGPPAQ